ncbi:MAG TPA: hypothetical protein VFB27_15575 [Opitutaceae bacterium]|nr:hypothetical protein [Opitutaceae bacterium]
MDSRQVNRQGKTGEIETLNLAAQKASAHGQDKRHKIPPGHAHPYLFPQPEKQRPVTKPAKIIQRPPQQAAEQGAGGEKDKGERNGRRTGNRPCARELNKEKSRQPEMKSQKQKKRRHSRPHEENPIRWIKYLRFGIGQKGAAQGGIRIP